MTLFRGIADDLPLKSWLYDHIWPAEARWLSPQFVRLGTQLAIAEMIRSGTTLFCDMYFFEDEVARAARDAGMRVVLGEALVDFPTASFKTPQEGLEYTEELLERWRGDRLVVPGVQPHSPYAASPELLQAAKDLADGYGAPYLMHVAETRHEVQESLERFGRTPVEHLANLGVLGPSAVAIHGVHLTDEDIELLAEHQTGVAHCPESQLKLASGLTPVHKLQQVGVKVALGTDGAASNNDLDLLGELSTAAKVHKFVAGDPTALTAKEAVRMVTRDAARLLGLDDRLGSLEVGKRADLVILDLDAPHMVPMYDVTSHLAYAAHASDVRTVIIDGQVVMRDRRLLSLDEAEIIARAREMAERIQADWNT
jgi:5-methylthioadenosine/S-adenosylhomocysteine deaminase